MRRDVMEAQEMPVGGDHRRDAEPLGGNASWGERG